jgi:hypothetical protein
MSSDALLARASSTATTSSSSSTWLMPNTTTPDGRMPSTVAIADSRSGGWYLRPCRMMRSGAAADEQFTVREVAQIAGLQPAGAQRFAARDGSSK